MSDWAKYTDEGWYGNAAARAHLFGNWYLPGDFNPAPAVPVWPFLEWILFSFTGVTIEAARGLAVAFFFVNLILSYLFLRIRGPRWVAFLGLTLIVTSPFLYCFSRLAILEPMLIALTLAALNLAVRLPQFRRPLVASAGIGFLFTLMMLTKTTAVFLLPALGWAIFASLWKHRGLALKSAATALAVFVATFAGWMLLLFQQHLFNDYDYLFFINKYIKPKELYWPIVSFWWSFHGTLWVDHFLIPLAGIVVLLTVIFWRAHWSRQLRHDPGFGASILAVLGYILFMTYQNHPQPRYYAVMAFFVFFVVAKGAHAFLQHSTENSASGSLGDTLMRLSPRSLTLSFGVACLAVAAAASMFAGFTTLEYATHPDYSFVNAAQDLTRYIDQHPNGKRLLVSISGDEISMVTHLPAICDDFGTEELVGKMVHYQPGWWATWNDVDPGTLEDLHNHYSLEQVASFRAFDDPDRNVLVLFKLHPLPDGEVRDTVDENLQAPLPEDKILIPVE